MEPDRMDDQDLDELVVEVVAAPVAPRPSRKPPEQELRMSARTYVRVRRYRWERAEGFLYDMKINHPGDRTRAEWDQLWDAFWARPV
jgi:hypothetical protein